MQKRGGTKQSIKIETSHILLNKRNIIFMLILVLLLIMILYFAIKTWPIMKERLSDEDNDGIKNYQDKCMSTPKGTTVDSYGCETVKESMHVEKPVFIEEDIEEENETIIQCSDSDGGKNIWIKGKCNDGSEKRDYCEENFGSKLYEYVCLNNVCDKEKIYCSDYNALCYDGRCIDKNKDTDKDGYPDLDEYGNGTDPENPDDHPENITIQSNCNSRCISLGYISGRGPVGSIGNCNSPEIGQYLSGNSGDICCCMPSSIGYYSFQQCTSLQNSHGAMFSQRQETDWTQSTCQAYANPRCNAINIGFDRNCCWWSCGAQITNEEKCQQYMTSKGYSYWALYIPSPEACYSKALKDCSDKGKQYNLSLYDSTIDCCIWSCKGSVNPNTGLDCSSKAVTPTSQADCSLRVGCSGATYCEFRYDHCTCSWIQDCVDSDFDEGYRYLEIFKHKGYCKKGSSTQNWDTCVNGKLREWYCGPTELCESSDIDCDEWFEGGYCEDGVCKSCLDSCPYYTHADYGEPRTQSQCIDFGNSWCITNSNSTWKAANAVGKCCCFMCW